MESYPFFDTPDGILRVTKNVQIFGNVQQKSDVWSDLSKNYIADWFYPPQRSRSDRKTATGTTVTP